jgi:hypothetical protein
MCIFSTPKLFAGIRKLYPEEYQLLKHDEEILEFMLDNKCDLDTFVGNAVCIMDMRKRFAVWSLENSRQTISMQKDSGCIRQGHFMG